MLLLIRIIHLKFEIYVKFAYLKFEIYVKFSQIIHLKFKSMSNLLIFKSLSNLLIWNLKFMSYLLEYSFEIQIYVKFTWIFFWNSMSNLLILKFEICVNFLWWYGFKSVEEITNKKESEKRRMKKNYRIPFNTGCCLQPVLKGVPLCANKKEPKQHPSVPVVGYNRY